MKNRIRFVLALACVGLAGPISAQTITEFPIPTSSNYDPLEVAKGPDGNLWFTESISNKIGRITTDGIVAELGLPMTGSGYDPVNNPYIGPEGIAAGRDDSLWFTEYSARKIGRITTAGVVTEFSIPSASEPGDIALGPDDAFWFTEANANRIGRITTAGVVTEFPIPTAGSSPSGIAAGPDGALWFTEFYGNRIGRITTAGAVTEFVVPTSGSEPYGIAPGPDGALWFTEPNANKIGRITTAGIITEFSTPTAGGPGGITAGPDGNLWFTGLLGNNIGRITIAGVVTETPIPTSGSRPNGIAAGPDGSMWFTEQLGHKIGRITTGPCTAAPTTLCLNGSRFRVTTDWQAASKGTSGHGTAAHLTADAGYFSFFEAANVEALVKILNGCNGAEGHYWVFAAGLTNVGVTLTVTDEQAHVSKVYTNPDGTAFLPIQDTSAFATCP